MPWRLAAACTLLYAGGAVQPLAAQDPGEPIDRVIAVVGNTAITRSQVEEELFSRQDSANPLPTELAALNVIRRQIIDTLIAEELLFQEALTDTTIKVTDQEVIDAADLNIRKTRQRFPSEVAYLAELQQAGFLTPEAYRRWMNERQRRELTVQRHRENLQQTERIKPLPPSEKEIRAYFDTHLADRTTATPATVSLRQIIVAPKPSAASGQRAHALADSIVIALRGGADFAVAARRFSNDPVSAAQGGDLGWFRRGVMVPEFEGVAFGLKLGVVSDAFETPFGWHILQVQRVQATEVQARHILIMPEVDSTSAAIARLRIDSVATAITMGARFDSLQRIYHDAAEERQIDQYPVDSLLPAYAQATAGLDSGQVSTPFLLAVPGQDLRAKWAIVRVVSRLPAGKLSYEQIKPGIRTFLAKQMGKDAYIRELRRKTYVDIREL
ncbi:MAG: peptidylprolyl isomerase [Gemmatimonadales bacterium]